MTAPAGHPPETSAPLFPPALVPVLRERCGTRTGCFSDVSDDVLVQLLTTVFFAGLETYEGERNTVGVAFLGRSLVDFVIPKGVETGAAPLYQWKVMRFVSPRPFVIPELVKLAVADADGRLYSAVHVIEGQGLAITGLAREGVNAEEDPFVKIVASRPGCLSVRSGRDLLLGYERGAILTGGEDVVFSSGPVRRALEAIARIASHDADIVSDYLDAVRSLVREMAAHGRGGILVLSPDEHPQVADSATYRMAVNSSLTALFRLAGRISRKQDAEPPFRHLLRNAFLTEAERVIEEVGALTGIDGAILLNRELALAAFGVILPVGRPTPIDEALDREGLRVRPIDFGSRGTRHRASATYAVEHPGSVVFVASEDGQVSCLFRDPAGQERVLLWRLGPAPALTSADRPSRDML